MNDDALQKVALNPAIRDVMQRVREAGLHKVARHLYNVEEVNLKTSLEKLGHDLFYNHLRHQKIRKGLEAYAKIEK